MGSKVSKQEILQDLKKVCEKVESPITQSEYNEKGEYSMGLIQDRFGNFNKAKDVADLEIIQRGYTKKGKHISTIDTGTIGYSKDELASKIEQFLNEKDEVLTFSNLSDFLDMKEKSLTHYFISSSPIESKFENLYDALSYVGYEVNDIFDEWEKVIKSNEMYGWYNYSEFREIISKESQFKFLKSSGQRNWGPSDFYDFVNKKTDNNLRINRGGKTNTIYVKNMDVDRYSEYKEDLPDNDFAEEVFQECISYGFAPNTTVAALNYMLSDKTQRDVADEFGCSPVPIRRIRDHIVDNGLDEKL